MERGMGSKEKGEREGKEKEDKEEGRGIRN